MLDVLVISAVLGVIAVRTRRRFAWDDAVPALMLISAGLMVVMTGSLALDGRWLGAAFMTPLTAAVVAPALILGRVPPPPPARKPDDGDDEDDGPGGGPPRDPPPDPPGGGIEWDRFDEARETWARETTGARA
jgi:hypothetical protein